MKDKQSPYGEAPEIYDFRALIAQCGSEYRDRPAFRYRERGAGIAEITYGRFAQDVEALATYWLDTLGTGKHIALIGANSYRWLVCYFSIVNSGNVVVPIDKELKSETVASLLSRADCGVVLYAKAYQPAVIPPDATAQCLEDLDAAMEAGRALLAAGDRRYAELAVDPNATCTIVFTSGTTAQPKGVMLSPHNMMADAVYGVRNLVTPPGTVVTLPLYHTFALTSGIVVQLLVGAPIFINSSMKRLLDDIQLASPRHICVVPMILNVFYERIWTVIRQNGNERKVRHLIRLSNVLLRCGIDLRRWFFRRIWQSFGGRLEMIVCGGSAIDEEIIRGFRDFGITVINGYGITECSPIVATMNKRHCDPTGVGTPLPGVSCRIEDGEILVKGDIVFVGYYRDPQATAEVLRDGWFHTGDLGRLDENGTLYITGRRKNLIVLSNGKNVSPEELEQRIAVFPEVVEVLVYAENDRIVAEVFPDAAVLNVQSVIRDKVEELNRHLAIFKQISSVKFRDAEFPKTATKKIKRNYAKV